MKEMIIDSIRVSMMNYQHVVILREKDSDRYLPIWIGPAEADAISVKLQNAEVARPLTHDLLRNTVFAFESASKTSLSRVVVNDLKSDTFYAQIIFEFNEGPMPASIKFSQGKSLGTGDDDGSPVSLIWQSREYKARVSRRWQDKSKKFIEVENSDGLLFELYLDETNKRWLLTKMKLDSRPSDAIALAVRSTTPIFVEDIVMDKAGIRLDRETGKPIPLEKNASEQGTPGKVDEQELKKLSPRFLDFINKLDLDDLGKHKS
jgi:bifunctional DNase/RNase